MGGLGSGNTSRVGSKSTTDDYQALDIRQLARAGVISAGFSGSWWWLRNGEVVASVRISTEVDRLALTYRHRTRAAEWHDAQYAVRIVRTPCHLGGSRIWFICPAANCGRRVAILYGGGIFACRHCYQLAYKSSRESVDDRAIRRAEKLRARLGWAPGIANGSEGRPRGMRQPTFARLAQEAEALGTRSMQVLMARLELLDVGTSQGANRNRRRS